MVNFIIKKEYHHLITYSHIVKISQTPYVFFKKMTILTAYCHSFWPYLEYNLQISAELKKR